MVKNVIVGANSYLARNFIYQLNNKYFESEYKLYGKEDNHCDGLDNYFKIDIFEKNSLNSIDLDCKNIFMFVGKTGALSGFDEYEEFIKINQISLLNLLNEYRIQKSHAKIIFISTRLVYSGLKGPQKENAPFDFKTVYAINKFACETYLKQFSKVFGVRFIVLRLCVPYGTFIKGATSYGTLEFLLNKAKRNENIELFGDGSQRRTITYIGDFCDILYNAANNDCCINDVYNVGGEDYSLYEMAKIIAEKYGVSVDHVSFPEYAEKIESGDTVFDSEKLDSIIGNFHKKKFIDWING